MCLNILCNGLNIRCARSNRHESNRDNTKQFPITWAQPTSRNVKSKEKTSLSKWDVEEVVEYSKYPDV